MEPAIRIFTTRCDHRCVAKHADLAEVKGMFECRFAAVIIFIIVLWLRQCALCLCFVLVSAIIAYKISTHSGDVMDSLGGLTPYDMVVLGLFALLIGRGIWLGLLKQVTGLVALYVGYYAASQYHTVIFPVLDKVSDNPKVVFLTSYVILFVVTYIVVMLLGKALGYVISLTITSWFDRILGGVVGFAKAAILVVILHMILGTVLAPESQMLRACMTCESLNNASDFTREFIRDENVRKSFLQQEPAIAIDAVKDIIAPPPREGSSE